MSSNLELVETVLALLLVGDRESGREVGLDRTGHGREDVVLVVEEARELAGLLGGLAGELDLSLAQGAEERLRGLEALGDNRLGGGGGALSDEVEGVVRCLGLDHHDRDVVTSDATGNDHVEDRALLLGVLGERDPLAVDERDAHAGDGAGERQARQLRRRRGRVDRERVVRVVGVDREDRDDDLDLVAQPGNERGAQRAVDQTAREDRVGRGAALATEERAGDLAGGVRTLLDVNGQREEVEAIARVLARGGGGQQHRVAVKVGGHGARGLLGQAARLEAHGARAEASVVNNGFGELDFGTFHVKGCSFSYKEQAGRTRAFA